jgi:tRNA pseudouridine38-40 synthase
VKRILLTIAYDGPPHSGWQSQRNGLGVQDHLESAIANVLKQPVRIHGAGRTDAGAHALGQTAHFDLPESSRLGMQEWLRALNILLPPSIRVMKVHAVAPSFHARFDAIGKTYLYRIVNGAVLPPHEFHRAWHVVSKMEEDLLTKTLKLFEGRHDFAAFSLRRRRPERSTLRRIDHIGIRRKSGGCFQLKFQGEGFLYRMVRMMVAASVRVAIGKLPAEVIPSLLKDPRSHLFHHVAPAEGLYLAKVHYERIASAA